MMVASGRPVRLSERMLDAATCPPGRRELWISDLAVRGLRVRILGGTKTFYCSWTDPRSGRRCREKLGRFGAITLEQARQAARAMLGRVALGEDVAAERRRAREADGLTFGRLIDDWARLHLARRRPRYAAEAVRAIKTTFQRHLGTPVARIDHALAARVLDRLVLDGKPGAARNALAYARACFGWAMKRRLVAVNPFHGLPSPEGSRAARDRVLAPEELGMIWHAAGTLGPPYRQAVRFMMLTLCRRDEAASMTWAELAPDMSVWTLPAGRSKNHRPHVVHLAAPARAVLRELVRLGLRDDEPDPAPAPERLVFGVLPRGGPISGWNWVKRRLDSAIADECAEAGRAPPAPWVLHDFRRAGVTWLAGEGFPPHVCDRLLNHVGGTISGVAAVYQKAEFLTERRAALEAWARHVVACGGGG
jgi:integrase